MHNVLTYAEHFNPMLQPQGLPMLIGRPGAKVHISQGPHGHVLALEGPIAGAANAQLWGFVVCSIVRVGEASWGEVVGLAAERNGGESVVGLHTRYTCALMSTPFSHISRPSPSRVPYNC